METNPEDSVTEESVPEDLNQGPQQRQPIQIQVPDEAIIGELRMELEQSTHNGRLLRLALSQAHAEIAEMRKQFDLLAAAVAKQSKKSKTKVQQVEAKPRKKGKKK